MRILAQLYLDRHGSPFEAYMALQRSLLGHYLLRGGSAEQWCERMAPLFRERYGALTAVE